MSDDLPVLRNYTIYRGASDVPTEYCVREWMISIGKPVRGQLWLANSLDEARQQIPPGASYRMPPDETDDPVIVETWM